MKKVKARIYDAHKDYNVEVDLELLNMKIRIAGSDYDQTGIADYEGSVGKFIKERVPAEFLVGLITELKYKDKISYRFHGGENFIQRIR
jgi:hypothetical protein